MSDLYQIVTLIIFIVNNDDDNDEFIKDDNNLSDDYESEFDFDVCSSEEDSENDDEWD